ncbi:recombination endonuclease subunit [Xanthomonas phage Xoo-sp13]|nr:recombination endonuclease subunit [Xanthomonas phage Xoo-sp13]
MSNKLKKAAIFSDIHFGKKNNSEEHNQDCLNFIEWFCEKVKEDPTIDHVWFLGDWHEHRAAINAFTLQRSYTGAKLLNDLGLPIMWITGNHDLAFRNTRTTFTTEIFEPFENIVLINDTQIIDTIHGGVLAIPYLREDEYPTLIEHSKVPVAMGHLELKGFRVSGSSNIMEHGPEAHTFFKKQKKVFSGHFHQRQSQGNVHYVGSPFCMDFSDVNDKKRGMAVYDFVNDDLDYIDWPNGPQYLRMPLTEVLENPKKFLTKGARVKLDVDTDITYEESNQIRASLQAKFDLREISLDEKITIDVNLTDDEAAIEELELETTNEVIIELLKRIKDSSVDTDLVLSLYNGLAQSSQDLQAKASDIRFISSTMQNYLSYGSDTTEVNLDFTTPTLIIGRNYDSVVDGQIDSNGAGKSTILNAILLCLFGKNLMDVDLNGQINKSNGKNMLLTVTMVVNGVYYKIERYRKNRPLGGDGVRVYRNNDKPEFTKDHDITPDSVANATAMIENIIGIPYDMFIRIVVFSAAHEPFLSLPSSHASKANQRDIIEELFGLTELTVKAELLKTELAASKAEFKNLVEINTKLEAEHARHDTQVNTNIARMEEWNASRDSRVETIVKQINDLEAIDVQNSIEGFEEVARLEKELTKVEKDVPALQSELSNIRTNASKFEAWEVTTAKTIDSLNKEIAKIKSIDFAGLRAVRDELVDLTAKSKLEKVRINGLTDRLMSATTSLSTKNVEKAKKLDEIAKLGDNLCPYCQQQFNEAKTKIAECNHSVSTLEEDIAELSADISAIESELDQVNDTYTNKITPRLIELNQFDIPDNLDQLETNLEVYVNQLDMAQKATNPYVPNEDDLSEEDIVESLAVIKAKADTIRSKMPMAKEFINSAFKSLADIQGHTVRIETLKNRHSEIVSETNPFTSVVDSLKETVLEAADHDRVNVLDKKIKHQDFLLKLLTKKDSFVRKALLNKSIPLLNSRLRYNLDKIGLPHKIQFTEQMDVSISQFSEPYEYGNFSAGQKARVNLCLAFAFRDVLQSRFGRINLCILDECLDVGLGNVGVSLAAKMIKAIGIENKLSMFVISHRDEVSNMFDSRLEIELRNGFSTILNSEEDVA